MLAARGRTAQAAERCGVLAVTVLTSLDGARSLARRGGGPMRSMSSDEVLRLAGAGGEAGAHGVVCSGREARASGRDSATGSALLVPGVRLAGGDAHDQARVVTPAAAQRRARAMSCSAGR